MHNSAHNSAKNYLSNATELSAVLSQMPGVVYRLFQATPEEPVRLTVVSDNCHLIFGVDRTVLEGEQPALLDYVYPADRESLISALAHSAQTLGCCLWTGRMLQPSGIVHWVHLTAQPSPMSQDQGTQWQGLLALALPPAELDQTDTPRQDESAMGLTAPAIAPSIPPSASPHSKESTVSVTTAVTSSILPPSPILDTAWSTLAPLDSNWLYSEERLALKHIVAERTSQLQQTVELLLDEVVERTQVERNLRDREAFLHSIYDNVSQAIFVVDVGVRGEFHYADLNAACEHLFNTTRDQVRGKIPEDVLGDRIGHILRQQYQQCLDQQVGVVFEEAVHLSTGAEWWRTQLTPLQDLNGRWYRIIGNITDITHAKQIEKNLKRRDRLLQGVAIATQYLITHSHLDQAIPKVLSTLATATGFDHVYILEFSEWLDAADVSSDPHSANPHGTAPNPVIGERPQLKLVEEWGHGGTCILSSSEGDESPWIDPQWVNPQWEDVPAMDMGRQQWYAKLVRGEAIMATIDQLPEVMQPYFQYYGVRAVLAEPIIIDGYVWGCICFEDCNYGYSWPMSERLVFRAVAANLAGAIARHHVETELMESTELLQLVMDNIPQAVFWKNRDSVYLGCNVTFAEAAGLEYTDDIVGKHDRDLCWHPEEAELYYQNDQFVITNDTPLYHVIEPQRQSDGKEILCEVNKIPLHDLDGNVVGVLGTFEDVTERQKAQDALRKSETKYRLQTQELQSTLDELRRTQVQLIQSEKMSSLGQLVAGIAHEINNPVNFIYGNVGHAYRYASDLLRLLNLYETYVPDPHPKLQRERDRIELDFLKVDFLKLLESMEIGAIRIREIVSSLRTFSRMDEAERKVVDIHEGLNSTLMLLRGRINPKRDNLPEVEIVKDYGDIPRLECFAGPLNQVFMNLLSNALDALEDAVRSYQQQQIDYYPCITIKTIMQPYSTISDSPPTHSSPQDRLVITISDNALGMAKSVQSRLFDPFFTTKPVGKGTGMGLSISYQIITERHGGTLECVSQPGDGTTFIVTLPVAQVS
ncbi:MAG: PAS domain-containing protein [Leptolyngbyaceae bacterium]|nr:PAS domain-containing protein [Leptolyngbyaceae bacterium]